MNYSKKKETIWHFTCNICKGWWSIAEGTEWKPNGPKNLYCPHCGKKCVDDIKTKYEGHNYTELLGALGPKDE